jgi:hypothetical protein
MNVPEVSKTKPFNLYNGSELLKIMLSQMYDEWKQHRIFGEHITYERAEFEVVLKVKSYARDVRQVEAKGKMETRYSDAKEETHVVMVKSGTNPATDQGRREAGLPVPKPQMTSGGIVDVIPKV